MSEKLEMIFMQVRLIRLASEEWGVSIQEAAAIFDEFDVFQFIDDCYGLFHTEGDRAVLNEIEVLIKNRGVDANAAAE